MIDNLSARSLAVSLLNFFFAIVEGFLALRLILKLFAANSSAPFVDWVYSMSSVLLDPFRGIFPTRVFEGNHVLEFSTLFAMLVYALFALIVLSLINFLAPPATAIVEPDTDTRRTTKVVKKRR
jgi:uncharacterized protein YggT (Ycf19 family)